MIKLKANGLTYTACEPSTLMYAPASAPATASGLVDALNNHLNSISGSDGCFIRAVFPAVYSPTGADKWLRGMYVAQNRNRVFPDYGDFLVTGFGEGDFFWGRLKKENDVDVIRWRKVVTTNV